MGRLEFLVGFVFSSSRRRNVCPYSSSTSGFSGGLFFCVCGCVGLLFGCGDLYCCRVAVWRGLGWGCLYFCWVDDVCAG
jgi:hypothetical protein